MFELRSCPDIRAVPNIRDVAAAEQPERDLSDVALLLGESGFDFGLDSDCDLVCDASLETAIFISLFTDRRAGDNDELPATEKDRRGWWGNELEDAGDEVGSKLWLLRREKQTAEVVRRAEGYARDALKWLVEDRVAKKVEIRGSIPRTGWLLLDIAVTKPNGQRVNIKYDYNWRSQEFAIGERRLYAI